MTNKSVIFILFLRNLFVKTEYQIVNMWSCVQHTEQRDSRIWSFCLEIDESVAAIIIPVATDHMVIDVYQLMLSAYGDVHAVISLCGPCLSTFVRPTYFYFTLWDLLPHISPE